MQHLSQAMQDCIRECLEVGRKHTEPEHFRLMMAYTTMYKNPADFTSIDTVLHKKTYGLCAGICTLCAEHCRSMAN